MIRTLILSLFITTKLYSQDKVPSDSLIKYSYFIMGVNYGDSSATQYLAQSQGSGFFIKYKSDTFFITAKHVLDGCDDNLVKHTYAPDRMSISLHDENGKPTYQWLSVFTKTIKDTSVCRLFAMYPDIIGYKVNNVHKYKIYLIENFSNTGLPKKKGNIKIFGFPSMANHEMLGNMPIYVDKPASNLLIKKFNLYANNQFSINNEISFSNRKIIHIDYFNYAINTTDIIIDEKIKGYSGSPCFIKDLTTDKWVFFGIQVAINPALNNLYIIKPKFILDQLINYQ